MCPWKVKDINKNCVEDILALTSGLKKNKHAHSPYLCNVKTPIPPAYDPLSECSADFNTETVI